MLKLRIFIFVLFGLFLSTVLQAQDMELFFNLSDTINQKGMYVLSVWALANIAYGLFGLTKSAGHTKRFHQMFISTEKYTSNSVQKYTILIE
ncbi:MAG: hypothetical protein CVT92_14445 [Bacteroidetes bacterium HGW-Bacteroidetes-1]|jgi:hypothetical protein|nr:MAG: hypothetical protein CVT92_14445 [Bacteroidetes bacterium HGW-Bacteroidetes-1]